MTLKILTFDEENNIETYESLDALGDTAGGVTLWVDVETDDIAQLTEVASYFNLHELSVEDCLTPGHFPKLEDYGTYLFMIFRGLRSWSEVEELWESNDEEVPLNEDQSYTYFTRKVALYLSQNFIITYRRREVPWLDALFRQIQQNPGKHLNDGTEGISHRVIDVLVDRFMRGLGFFENIIENIEDIALEKPDTFDVSDLFEIKRELSSLRQVARNQRNAVSKLATDPTLIQDTQRRRYFKDIDDHCDSILRILDKGIQDLVNIRDSYIALSNVRLGDTMRILTVITTIAAPMNIVVGIYGMNFSVIPLLDSPYGFWTVLSVMVLLGVMMLLFFRRNRWI